MGRHKGDLSLLERLLDKVVVDEVTDCWIFTGGKNNIGYGMIRDENKMRTTHRVSYEEHNNTVIPQGLVVMHSCDNKCCCNPAHLSLGTMKDNMHDMIAKNRHRPFGGNLAQRGMTGKKQPTTPCKHCNRVMPNNSYARFHGDNCKSKK